MRRAAARKFSGCAELIRQLDWWPFEIRWVVIIVLASFIPMIRNVADLLPDHQLSPTAVEAPAEGVESAVSA